MAFVTAVQLVAETAARLDGRKVAEMAGKSADYLVAWWDLMLALKSEMKSVEA
jgi:hypothetical protein